MRLAVIILLIFFIGKITLAQSSPPASGHVASEGVPLRLRSGPGLNYSVVALLTDGSSLNITGRTADSTWFEVLTVNTSLAGWVYSTYVDTPADFMAIPISSQRLSFPNLITGIGDEARRIFHRGQALGNQANRFAKVGDSITVSRNFWHPIGNGFYDLAAYDYLQPVIDYFAPSPTNVFVRESVAAGVGWNAAAVLLPEFADSSQCRPGEMPLRCEYRLLQPAYALIMFGTNDVGYVPLTTFQSNMERIVDISSEMGVVPVLSTIPPRTGYESQVNAYNAFIRDLSQQRQLPLWDYGLAMTVYMPSSLGFDGVHPSLPPRGLDGAANFQPENIPFGYVLRNLSALHVLDSLWREIVLYVPEPEATEIVAPED